MKWFISFVVVYIVICFFKSVHTLTLKGNDRLRSSEEQEEIDYNEIFETIPEEDRLKFIKLHLAIGLTECHSAKTYSIDLPEDVDIDQETYEVLLEYKFPNDFSTKLLHWVEEHFHLTLEDIYRMVCFSQVCFPSGCVDPADIGSLCCPFK